MKELFGSETEKNLVKAFAHESQFRNRFAIFAKKAKKEGYVQIYELLNKISDQEQAHGNRLFKFLSGEKIEMTSTFFSYGSGTTLENLENSLESKKIVSKNLYSNFADIARSEGYNGVAVVFESIINAEKYHEKILSRLIEKLENDSFFKREENVLWHCIKCGYTFIGKEAPKACPACAHGQAYFEVLGEN